MWWKTVDRLLGRASTKSATKRTKDGVATVVSRRFQGIPLSVLQEVNATVENECKIRFEQINGNTDTLEDLKNRSAQLRDTLLDVAVSGGNVLSNVQDAFSYRDMLTGLGGGHGGSGRGGVGNRAWSTGMSGQDPGLSNVIKPNIYMSPGEAASVYSQKGIPELIINKKARTMLNNGVRITNSKLSPEQLEIINENMLSTDLAKQISDGIKDSLVYGGSVLFPFFKGESPLSAILPVGELLRYGIIKKGCLDRWVRLDRWNTVHYPNWNPTASDYLKPRYFFIPFLGSDVHSSRMARIVTAPQPGYWGNLMTLGWGLSDIPGWIEAEYDYENIMSAIPTMIQQMSLLVRTFNVDGPLAMEGAMMLEQMSDEETIRIRQSSPNNPINMDVVGKLEAVQRNFAEVPELTRLVRQNLAAKAGFLEESLFTVEKKGMGAGNQSDEKWARQEETNRFMYSEVQSQLKPVAMIQVINALGPTRAVLEALPYTRIVFDEQRITDAGERIELTSAASKAMFDAIAAGIPMSDAVSLVNQLSGGAIVINTHLMKELKARQEELDQRDQEKHDADVRLIESQIKAAEAGALAAKVGGSSSANGNGDAKTNTPDPTKKQGHSYDDPLKQRSKEIINTGGSRRKLQGVQKARGKFQA